MSVKEKLEELGIQIPGVAPPVATYVPTVRTGNLVFVAGTVPRREDGSWITGKLGQDLSVEQGYEAARMVAISILASLQSAVEDLEKVTQIVRLFCMVNCTPDFTQQPQIANGASDLFVAIFGERGRHARAAVGMNSLPNNAAVEIEAIVEVE